MPNVRLARVRRAALHLTGALTLLLVVAVAAFLPFAGRFLVIDDPPQASDAVFVLAGARVERWLEAVDLYRERIAPRIVLSPGRMEPAEEDLRRTGVRIPNDGEIARDAMIQLGIPGEAIAILPGSLDNTAHEAAALRTFVATTGWKTVTVVTSRYHTRRTRFAFAREFRGTDLSILVRATRHDRSDPRRWWRSRSDARFVINELQKLLAYRIGLGE